MREIMLQLISRCILNVCFLSKIKSVSAILAEQYYVRARRSANGRSVNGRRSANGRSANGHSANGNPNEGPNGGQPLAEAE